MIGQLKTDKLNLTAELDESNSRATEARELRQLAEDEITRLKLTIQAAEEDKQRLEQQVQSLTRLVEYVKNTTAQSVDDFMNKLKVDLSLLAAR